MRALLRDFYRAHLRRYRAMRWLRGRAAAVSTWLVRLRCVLLWPLFARSFQLVPMGAFLQQNDCRVFAFDTPAPLHIPPPRFFGRSESVPMARTEPIEINPLPLWVGEVSNAAVVGGTNFVLAGEQAIHPDCYLPEREVCPAETFGVARIKAKQNRIAMYMRSDSRKVGRAVSLLGQCTGNYAHWLTEILPKLLIADSLPQYDGLPLLIDDGIHPVFYESVNVLGARQRDIIRIGRWQTLALDSVVVVSPTAYIPAEYREFVTTGKLVELRSDEFKFSLRALTMLRDRAWQAVAPRGGDGAKRLYLHRDSSGNGRRLIDVEQVEKLAAQFGFQVIEPGVMKFADQVRALRDAEIVMAPIGAALTNTIFSPPGCRVVAISPCYEGANYDYYAHLMGILGHDLCYVLGPQTGRGGHPLHRDYRTDIAALRAVLDRLCPPSPCGYIRSAIPLSV